MKKALKVILLCLAIVVAAWFIGTFLGSLIKTGSLVEALSRTFSMESATKVIIPIQILAAFAIAVLLHIVLHEAGHLVLGLMSGYKFSSFSAFGLILVREPDGIKLKRFSVPGVGGQCLMVPPECEGEKVPVVAYNAGGILFNLILVIIVLLLILFTHTSSLFVNALLVSIIFVGVFLIIMNGIPMHVQGMPNDGFNMLKLGRNPKSRQAFATILKLNEMGIRGVRPKDMSPDYFLIVDQVEELDFSEPIQVNLLTMYTTHLIDNGNLDKARHYLQVLLESNTKVLVFKLIAKCELACICMMQGEASDSDDNLDKQETATLKALEKSSSSIKRYWFLKALVEENDYEKAEAIYRDVLDNPDKFLVKCEWEMDTEIMRNVLAKRKSLNALQSYTLCTKYMRIFE